MAEAKSDLSCRRSRYRVSKSSEPLHTCLGDNALTTFIDLRSCLKNVHPPCLQAQFPLFLHTLLFLFVVLLNFSLTLSLSLLLNILTSGKDSLER